MPANAPAAGGRLRSRAAFAIRGKRRKIRMWQCQHLVRSLLALWQGVASTALGPSALKMGARGVAAGLGLHLAVALTWSAVCVLAIAKSSTLRGWIERPLGALAVATVYGPIIWLVMSCAVIPLATGRLPALRFRWWVQVFAHVPFVTIPLVFTARRALLPRRLRQE